MEWDAFAASGMAVRGNEKRPGGRWDRLAEEVGFEPTELSFNDFQDRHLKPLGHSSTYYIVVIKALNPFNLKSFKTLSALALTLKAPT